MLSTKKMERIMVDIIAGRPIRYKDKESIEFAEKIRPEMEKAKKQGAKFAIPWDYNDDESTDGWG